jgi:hypothetical protein
VKKTDKEVAVEGMELVPSLEFSNSAQPVLQVVGVAIEETLLLDEVHEHQPVEHQRRVPLQVGLALDPLDELQEGGMLGLEAVVEAFGDAIDVEGRASPTGDLDDRDVFLLVEYHGDLVETLNESVPRCRNIEAMVPTGNRLARIASHPLPDLLAGGLVGVDDEVFAGRLGDLVVDFATNVAIGNRGTNVSGKATLLCDCNKMVRLAIDRDVECGLVLIPAQMFAEERAEVKGFQALPNGFDVELHAAHPSITWSPAGPESK